jgi:signal peptidase II
LKLKHYLTFFGIAGVIIALDQWTKHLVRINIPFGGVGWEAFDGFARIVHWHNTGAAFGMFQGGSTVFAILAVIVSGVIIWFFSQVEDEDWFLRLALSMQLAGAVGNLIDRLLFDGRVTDFISLGKFAVFNVADASITAGTGIMLIGIWILERREKQAQQESDADQESETESLSGMQDSV